MWRGRGRGVERSVWRLLADMGGDGVDNSSMTDLLLEFGLGTVDKDDFASTHNWINGPFKLRNRLNVVAMPRFMPKIEVARFKATSTKARTVTATVSVDWRLFYCVRGSHIISLHFSWHPCTSTRPLHHYLQRILSKHSTDHIYLIFHHSSSRLIRPRQRDSEQRQEEIRRQVEVSALVQHWIAFPP